MQLIGWDVETWLIAAGRQVPPLVCLSYDTGSAREVVARHRAVELWRQWLADPDVYLVAHHGRFDCCVMLNEAPDTWPAFVRAMEAGRILCTEQAERLIKIALGHNKYCPIQKGKLSYKLATLVKQYFDIVIEGKSGDDAWRFRYRELHDVPRSEWPESAVRYSQMDATWARKLLLAQTKRWARLQAQHTNWGDGALPPTYFEQMKTDFALEPAGAWGIRTGRPEVAALEANCRRVIDAEVEHLEGAGLVRRNPKTKAGYSRDVKAIRARVTAAYTALAEEAQVPPSVYFDKLLTDNGKDLKTDRDTLLGAGDKLLSRLGGIGAYEKVWSTYLPVFRQALDRPYNPWWNNLVSSGRTSGNLQQLPKMEGVRDCVVPREGFGFIFADYDGAELVSLAQVQKTQFGTSTMGDAINRGMDLHLLTASMLLSITYGEARRRYDAGDKDLIFWRQVSKASNFGIPGGMGVAKMVVYYSGYGVEMTREKCAEVKRKWLQLYPEMVPFFEEIGQLCAHPGATAVHGNTGFLRGDLSYCAAANHQFQHLMAMYSKDSLWELTKRMYACPSSALYGSRLVLFAHDENLLETPLDKISGAAAELQSVMEASCDKYCPDVKGGAVAAAGWRWTKGAQPHFDAGGHIVMPPKPAPLEMPS